LEVKQRVPCRELAIRWRKEQIFELAEARIKIARICFIITRACRSTSAVALGKEPRVWQG
jgi:hypothetical protein